jgi:hypothetical protein
VLGVRRTRVDYIVFKNTQIKVLHEACDAYRRDTLPGGAILCNYYIPQISADISIHESHDPSMETREDSPGGQFVGF